MLGQETYGMIAKISADTSELNQGFSKAVGMVKGFKSKLVGIAGTIGLGKLISESITEGGKLEQSIGGTQKLFGDMYDVVKKKCRCCLFYRSGKC